MDGTAHGALMKADNQALWLPAIFRNLGQSVVRDSKRALQSLTAPEVDHVI
jgi:hypothetical protein